MENLNNTPQEAAPVASAPETPAPPAAAPVQASNPAPAAAEAPKGEMPKTDGKTPGGWNRFAGYNPNAAKNKPKDRRESRGRR